MLLLCHAAWEEPQPPPQPQERGTGMEQVYTVDIYIYN